MRIKNIKKGYLVKIYKQLLIMCVSLFGIHQLCSMSPSVDPIDILFHSMEIEKEEEAVKAWQDWCQEIVNIPIGEPIPRFVPDPTPEQLEEGKAFANSLERETAPIRAAAEREEKAAQLIFERSNRKMLEQVSRITSRILLHSQLSRNQLAAQQRPPNAR
jgi:hypothetical protein